MMLEKKQYKIDEKSILNYYELKNNKPKLLLIHAQGTDSLSYQNVIAKLSKQYHLYLVGCYGHGQSSRNKEKYNLISIGTDLITFIQAVINDEFAVLGHSSGGLIAAYLAAHCSKCSKLILEDPPFFSCVGERRFNAYNYKDLSSVCHNFLLQNEEKDFVSYYFAHQYCWNFFPEKSRENIRSKLSGFAAKYRCKHPDKNLKVPFWPKRFLAGFQGLQWYDPAFGETFYDDSFHQNVDYNELLSAIDCPTLFLKAKSTIGEDGLLQGALSDEDLKQVCSLVNDISVEYFDCGHGIHTEKAKQFAKAVLSF